MEAHRIALQTNILLTRARATDRRLIDDLYPGAEEAMITWVGEWEAACVERFRVREERIVAAPDGGPTRYLSVPRGEDARLGFDVPTVLRLLKPGKMWCITSGCAAAGAGAWAQNWEAYPQFASRGLYEQGGYRLGKRDIPQLKRLWTLYRGGSHRDSHALSQAVDRLNRSYSLRPIDAAERVAELVVGLEALFLYEAEEVSYRLGLRCACLLSPDPLERARVCSELRSGYLVRSRFVHGAAAPERVKLLEGPVTLEQLAARLEHRLRTAIRLFLLLLETVDEKTLKRHLLDENILAGRRSTLAQALSKPSARWLFRPRPA
jgi:hypothetical protein